MAKRKTDLPRREWSGNDNYGRPKSEYVAKVRAMTDEQLLKEADDKIWFSAYAANNRRSDFHWHVEVVYDECVHRGRVDIYEQAYQDVERRTCG